MSSLGPGLILSGGGSGGAVEDAGSFFVLNEAGANKDFRIEGDTDTNLLFIDAGEERVGIGTATPATKLDVVGAVTISGILSVDNTTDSSSVTTGSIHTDGGLGIAKELRIGKGTAFNALTANKQCSTRGGNKQDIAQTPILLDDGGRAIYFIHGQDASDSGNKWFDVVIYDRGISAPVALHSVTIDGTVPNRIYTRSGSNMMLAMFADTYNVNWFGLALADPT